MKIGITATVRADDPYKTRGFKTVSLILDSLVPQNFLKGKLESDNEVYSHFHAHSYLLYDAS